MTEIVAPEPTPEQAALLARVRRMMLIAGLTTALAVAAVLIAIGYRLFRSEGSIVTTDTTATLPKGARIVSSGVAGDRLVITLDIGGGTEIRTFDARTLKPAGQLNSSASREGIVTCCRSPPSAWPGLSRPSTSFFVAAKTWMPGTSPGMTTEPQSQAHPPCRQPISRLFPRPTLPSSSG